MTTPPLPKMLLAATLCALAACASPRAAAPPDTTLGKVAPLPAPDPKMPAEDVARYRPVPPPAPAEPAAAPATPPPPLARPTGAPTAHVTPQVEQRLRDQAYNNLNVRYAQGFRILVYMGVEREQAMAIRREVISRFPEETDYLTYKAPVFRLYIGDYLNEREAARGMSRLKGLTQRRELVSTQVLINKTP